MASFQIVYDDFSGGQYMGPKSTNWPKNTFQGENVLTTTHGEVIPTGAYPLGYADAPVNVDYAQIRDLWQVANTAYAFVDWASGATHYAQMITNLTESVTSTYSYNLGGTIAGRVAFDATGNTFYYVTNTGSGSDIRKITTSGTDTSVSSGVFTGLYTPTEIALYNYRLICWGPLSARLYYSNTDKTTFSTSQYYEFNGLILNVAARTNDLLVFTTAGLYSLVGVLGSSVSIQLLSPSLNIIEGMQDMALVNRTPYFLDEQETGQIDGRLHRMIGASTEMVAAITADDVAAANASIGAVNNYQVARVSTINNSAIVIQLKNGTSYVQTRSGTWVRLKYTITPTPIYAQKQYAVAKYAVKNAVIDQYPADEFYVAAYLDGTHAKRRLTFYRYIHNVYQAPYLDQNFAAPWTSGTVLATGTVRLSEYWHQRPFSVRRVIIEYKTSSNASVTATVEPTGCLDALASNISSLTSTGVAAGSQATSAYVTEQFLCDNASKGYGAKVSLSLQGCSVRRVILNCED